ncbi:transposase domain-containing protein, partial [Sinorhizobium meliloti]|uniref:transposase domain-containing protein n=1 Tax=Rhizobium meliloti TaxID=382 RepID=UPI000FE0ECAC
SSPADPTKQGARSSRKPGAQSSRNKGAASSESAVKPFAYLSDTLTAIVHGHKQSQIEALMPWNYSRQND